MNKSMKHKIAVQLYTLREACKSDFPKVLREISQMGYAGVQFAGLHGYDPAELKAVIEETGLGVAGMHVGYADIAQQPERVIGEAKRFGTPDIVCPAVPSELRTEEGYRLVRAELNAFARKVRPEGLRVSYHNHAFEFETSVDGKDALTYMLEPVEGNDVLAEIDVYWVKKGGYDPVSYLAPYAGRMPIVHLKDMTDDEERAFAPVGTGSIDFGPILRCGEASGVEWYVVEQDVCKQDPMDCVRTSLEQLTKLIDATGVAR